LRLRGDAGGEPPNQPRGEEGLTSALIPDTLASGDKKQREPMTDLPLERDFDAAYGIPEQVSGLVRRVVCRNPGPFTFTGTNSYVVGRGEVAIVDPGPDDEAHLAALMAAVEGEMVSHIVVTHSHRDHSCLVPRLKALTAAPVYGLGLAPGAGAHGGEGLDAAFDLAFKPDEVLRHGDVIEGSNWTLEALHTPGHTSDHLALALAQENALFSGDHVMAWSTSVVAPPDGNMADYFASLRLLLGRGEAVYWPGHGGPTRNPKRLVRALIAHRQMREAAILERIRNGDHTVRDVVRAVYRDVDPRLHGAAAQSALAHVEHLIAQGRVACDGAATVTAQLRAV
jgi:glyoxylase-like metal-dependent hydrolase (beta-lactamase superfamily II)